MSQDLGGAIDEARLVEWAQAFVRYPSPQTERFEAEPAVLGFIADCVAPLVEELGLPARRDAMGNLIVELGPESGRPGILLMAYAMTHPASSMDQPYGGEIVESGRGAALRGRGVAEQKGSLAAALAAVAAAHRQGGLGGRLVFTVSTAGETGRHDAAISIVEALGQTPELGVIVIGSGRRVALGNKGRIDLEITVRGTASHSSTPWLGVDAIAGARQVIERLGNLDLGDDQHPGLGRATLTPTHVRSWPEATHTVQNEVRLTFDRRLLPGQAPEPALEQVRAALAGIAPCRVEVRPGPYMYPGEVAEDGALISAIREGHARAGLAAPELFWSHGCLDAGYLIEQGCQCTMWGPGDMELWHSDEETVAVADLIDGARAYLGFIESALMSG